MRNLVAISMLLLSVGGTGLTMAADRLTIGSKAPSLDVEHWLTDKEPITNFENGKVYVVEFWATWCGPCVASMPHLRDLQQQHGQDVCVIGVSDEELGTVETFLEREVEGTTFKEITGAYWLATDPDGSVEQDYMRAADQHGIPTAFLIGKNGESEWIGHPQRIDEPVAKVLNDTWDREAFVRDHREEQKVRREMQRVLAMAKAERFTDALAALDAMLGETQAPEIRKSVEALKQRVEREAREHLDGPQKVPADRSRSPRFDLQSLAIGDRITIPLTGRKTGPIWGDAVYTLDSDPGTAAVHAGLVRDGETKTVAVWVVPSPIAYSEASRNGVQSRKWGPYKAAFVMQLAAPLAKVAGERKRAEEVQPSGEEVFTLSDEALLRLNFQPDAKQTARIVDRRDVPGPGVEFDIEFKGNVDANCTGQWVYRAEENGDNTDTVLSDDLSAFKAFGLEFELLGVDGKRPAAFEAPLIAGAFINGYRPEVINTNDKPKATSITRSAQKKLRQLGFVVNLPGWWYKSDQTRNPWPQEGCVVTIRVAAATAAVPLPLATERRSQR